MTVLVNLLYAGLVWNFEAFSPASWRFLMGILISKVLKTLYLVIWYIYWNWDGSELFFKSRLISFNGWNIWTAAALVIVRSWERNLSPFFWLLTENGVRWGSSLWPWALDLFSCRFFQKWERHSKILLDSKPWFNLLIFMFWCTINVNVASNRERHCYLLGFSYMQKLLGLQWFWDFVWSLIFGLPFHVWLELK